jgi:hypothetical protein
MSGLHLLHLAGCSVDWLGVAWRQEEDHEGGYFVSVEKSNDDLCEEEKAKVLGSNR